MTDMGSYTFRRARLRSSETWTVADTVLTGPSGTVDLGAARNARFAINAAYKRLWHIQMIFEYDGRDVSLTCSDYPRRGDFHSALALASEVTEIYGRLNPGATIAPTAGDKIQTWFLTALAAAIIGGGLYKIADALTDDYGVGFGVGLGGGVALLGLLLLWGVSPWQKRGMKTPGEVQTWIARVREMHQ